MRNVLQFRLWWIFLAILPICCLLASVRSYLGRIESQRTFVRWCELRKAEVVRYCEAGHLGPEERPRGFLERKLGIDGASSISAILGIEISNVADAIHLRDQLRLRTKSAAILVFADFAPNIPVKTQESFAGLDNFDGDIGHLPHVSGQFRPFIRDGKLTSKFPYEE